MEEILKNIGPKEIMKYQQNRPPLLFVDEISEAIPGKSARGSKVFAYNEYFLSSQQNEQPIVPSSIITEMLAQVFLMTFLTLDEYKGMKTSIISSEVKYFKDITSGKKINIISELKSLKRGIATGISTGYFATGGGIYENEICASAEFKVVVPDIMNKFIPNKNKE